MGDFSADFSNDFFNLRVHLNMITAVTAGYIMIRGLDNVETGLRIEGCDLGISKR